MYEIIRHSPAITRSTLNATLRKIINPFLLFAAINIQYTFCLFFSKEAVR